jgi:hypothetical protein
MLELGVPFGHYRFSKMLSLRPPDDLALRTGKW